MQTVKEIDLAKRKVEAKYIPKIYKIFKNMAKDAGALYQASNTIPSESLARNYRPEFLKEIRDMQRETIKYFGFDIRDAALQKGFNFKIEKQLALFDYQFQTKDIDIAQSQEDKINIDFILASSLFVANESEIQADYIQDTNVKEIDDFEKAAIILFFTQQADLLTQIDKTRHKITDLSSSISSENFDQISIEKQKIKLEKELTKLNQELNNLEANKSKIIAEEIEKKIENRGISRSELISSQNVGMAESFARNKEATLINDDISEIEIKKKWVAILDSRTRPSHVSADNQVVEQNGKFIVGGHKADYPRDSTLPIEETINCRCVAYHFWR